MEFVQARSSPPGEFSGIIETLREQLKDRNGETSPVWYHDFSKADEIFGKQPPPFVIEYSERAAAGDLVPPESWDGWLFFLDPARKRSFLVGGQSKAISGQVKSEIPRGMREDLRKSEAVLRDRVISFAKAQRDLVLLESESHWPAIRYGTRVLECREAEETTPTIVGYHVEFASDILRDSPDHPESLRDRELFGRLRKSKHPQQVTFDSARSPSSQLEFWVDQDSDLVFSKVAHLGSVNDRGIVQWAMLPFGTSNPTLLSKYSEIETIADREDELAHVEQLSKESPEGATACRSVQERKLACHRCGAVIDDARLVFRWKGAIRVNCPRCHLGVNLP